MPDSLESPEIITRTRGRRPRIALAVHQGFSIRYLLQTDIFRTLQVADCDLIILAQDDPTYLASQFGKQKVEYASIPWEVGRDYANRSRIERILNFLRHYAHRGFVRVSEHHYWIAVQDGHLFERGIRWWLRHGVIRLAILSARRIKSLRKLILWGLSRYVPPQHVETLARLKPDMIVTTSLGTFDYDQYVMRAADKLGIPTVAVVLSWDNTTCRGYPGVQPWHVIAWTDVMRRELIEHNDVPPDRISVCGIAHFDLYFRPDEKFDRSVFMRSLGLDPDKRVVLVATKSPNTFAFNPNLGAILGKAIEDGRLPADIQVVLRIHPLFYRYREGRFLFANALEACREVAKRYSAVHLNEPDIRSQKVDYDMREAETLFMARLLRSTDVLVNIYSTMNIEGAIFDIPLINAKIEEEKALYDAKIGARFDIRIDHDSDHNLRIVDCGGARVASTAEELVDFVAAYLADPSRDQAGRERVVQQEVGPNRGKAGEAIGARILDLAKRLASSS